MTAPKFTSGKWSIEDEGVGDLGMRESSIVNRDHDGEDWCVATVHSGLANAHLIASAPELYAKLTDVADRMRGMTSYAAESFDFGNEAEEIESLLAKARGEG